MVARSYDDVAARGAASWRSSVGVAGLVDAGRATVSVAPNLGWQDVPVASMLRERLGEPAYPVVIDNEANLAAVAEADPTDPSRRDMLVVFGEAGVGGGVIADGRRCGAVTATPASSVT